MDSYEEAVTTGADNTRAVMKAISAACPNTKFSIVGYSEGADVVRRVAMDIGSESSTSGINPDNVVGVVIFADAGRLAGEGPFPGAKNPYTNPDGFNEQYQDGKKHRFRIWCTSRYQWGLRGPERQDCVVLL